MFRRTEQKIHIKYAWKTKEQSDETKVGWAISSKAILATFLT